MHSLLYLPHLPDLSPSLSLQYLWDQLIPLCSPYPSHSPPSISASIGSEAKVEPLLSSLQSDHPSSRRMDCSKETVLSQK